MDELTATTIKNAAADCDTAADNISDGYVDGVADGLAEIAVALRLVLIANRIMPESAV